MSIEGGRDACSFFISRLSHQIEGLLLKKYPGDLPGTKKWLRLMSGVLDTARRYLEASAATGVAPADERKLVQEAGELAIMAYELMKMASGTDLSELPYAVVLPLQRWFSAPGLTNTTIFRAELVANYEIATIQAKTFQRIRNPSASLTTAIGEIDWPLERITVPSRALGMLPHFAVVAHEIGHAIYGRVAWDFSAQDNDLLEMRRRISLRLPGQNINAEQNIFISQVFLNWLQEIVSDAFGHLMAGPAFFFALGGFLQTVGGGLGISDGYPANETRLNIIYSRLQGSPGASFTEIFEKHSQAKLDRHLNSALLPQLPDKNTLIRHLWPRLDSSPGVTAADKAAVIAEMTEYIYAIADQVYLQAEDYLRTNCPDAIYDVGKFDADTEAHLEPLIQAIPPIESGRLLNERTPTEFSTIINVGWVVYLIKLDMLAVRTSAEGGRAEKADKLHSLLLKAVELSEARRAWESAT